jgi:hypothetical protein
LEAQEEVRAMGWRMAKVTEWGMVKDLVLARGSHRVWEKEVPMPKALAWRWGLALVWILRVASRRA